MERCGGARRFAVARVCAVLWTASAAGTTALWAQTPAAVDQTQQATLLPPLGLPQGRKGSGTSWLPDETPMYAVHGRRGPWDLMGHGNVFAQYLYDSGERGVDQFGGINWLMGMAGRSWLGGRIGARGMVSFEPWTIGGCGYPDLLASGESCNGRPIVDRQHPHDLFMELAVKYNDRAIGDSLGIQIYGGPVGEPALGPVAFPHRVSAIANPIAPISHHWLDATHITFGVVTGAMYGRRWKLEASAFNGREPDEDRADLDLDAPDSVSGRVSWLPTDRLALQVSGGRLKEAEGGDGGVPPIDVNRVTASATYHRLLQTGSGIWASTFAWGRNAEAGHATSFLLAETSVILADRHAWFARVDAGRKPARDLELEDAADAVSLAKLQSGYVRYFTAIGSWKPGIGGTMSLGVVPTRLVAAYGDRATFGFGAFVTLRPAGTMPGIDPHAGHRMP